MLLLAKETADIYLCWDFLRRVKVRVVQVDVVHNLVAVENRMGEHLVAQSAGR